MVGGFVTGPDRNHQGIGMTSQRTRDRLIRRLEQQGISDERVLDVIRRVPRHLFVDEALAHRAYEDTALPIGYGQTISQPFIVARMTELLLEEGMANSVLEIGTGCGYQTAVLANIFPQVYSVERIEALYLQARQRLTELNLYNVQLRHTDGIEGWPNPSYRFERIIMTAACTEIPQALAAQLTEGGSMVLPFDNGIDQTMTRITRGREGLVSESLEKVVFVPLLPGLG